MKISNSKYLKIPSDDTVIWRYFDFPKFASLLFNESLWFSRVDYLTDSYEGELPHYNADDFVENLEKIDPFMPPNERLNRGLNEIKNVRRFKKFTYVNSWSMNNDESFALWKIYLNNSRQGIAIKSNVGRIRKCFNSSEYNGDIGEINYSDKVSEVNQDFIYGTKKTYYEFEKEFRIIIKNHFKIVNNDSGKHGREPYDIKGLNLKVDLDVLIDSVVMSPFCDDWFIDLVIKIVKDKFSDKTIIIRHSNIKDK